MLALALFYFVYGIQLLGRRRYVDYRANVMFLVGALCVPVAFFVKRVDIMNTVADVWGTYSVLLRHVPAERLLEYRGSFVDSSTFRLLVLGFVPFSLFSVLHPSVWMRQRVEKSFFYQYLLLLYGALLVLLVLTFAPVIYQSRFSIILDLVLLIFAVPTLLLLVEHGVQDSRGRPLLASVLAVLVLGMGLRVHRQQPMLSPRELQEIQQIASVVEPTAGVLTTDSYYGPWLWGYFRWSSMSPGYLGDAWNYATWDRFWNGPSDEERLRLLGSRDHPPPPMYLYIGERQPLHAPYVQFIRSSSAFTQILPHLWKFTGDPRGKTVPSMP